MKVVIMKFGGSKGERMGIRSVFLWGLAFLVMSRRIARRVSSLVCVVLSERLAVVGGNCLQRGVRPVRRRQVLGESM